MSMRDPDLRDPNLRDPELRRTSMYDRRGGSSWAWIAGAIVLLLLVGALAYNWSDAPTSTAGTSASPPATTGAAPGGSPPRPTPPAGNTPAPAR
jgi:hypothetical protein